MNPPAAVDGFYVHVVLKEGMQLVRFTSAQTTLHYVENTNRGEIDHLAIVLLCLNITDGNGNLNGLPAELEKLVESAEIKAFRIKLSLSHWRTIHPQVAIDVKKVINRSIVSGVKFESLQMVHWDDPMLQEEVAALTEDIDTVPVENLPVFSFWIKSSVGITLLAHCRKIGWPIKQVCFRQIKSDADWREATESTEGATFGIEVWKEKSEVIVNLRAILDAVRNAEGEVKFCQYADHMGDIVTALWDQNLPRWRHPSNDQVKSLEIDLTKSNVNNEAIIGFKGTVCTVQTPPVYDFFNSIALNYVKDKDGLLKSEKIVIIGWKELLPRIHVFIESVIRLNHCLLSFTCKLDGDDIILPLEFKKQIEKNLSKRIGTWIKNGTRVNYGRIKLMVIGKGQAGKTSTVRSLLGEDFDPNVASTVVADASKDVSIKVQDVSCSTWEAKNVVGTWIADEMGHYLGKVRNNVDTGKQEVIVSDVPTSDVRQTEPSNVEGHHNKNASHDLTFEVVQNILQEVSHQQNGQARKLEQEDECGKLTIWDFGGQEIFYSLHHLFLTKGGLYLLVVNLELMQEQSKPEMLLVEFWLSSISLQAPGASVILVGTRADEISEARLKDIDLKLLKAVEDKDIALLQASRFCFFPIDNSNRELLKEYIDPLKARILRCFQEETGTEGQEKHKEKIWQKKIPMSWIYFMNHLVTRFKGIISANQFYQIAEGMNLQTERDILPLLDFYTAAGGLIPFVRKDANNQGIVSENIVLSPQWLLQVIGTFIYDKSVHNKSKRFHNDAKMRNLMKNYENTGILSQYLFVQILASVNVVQELGFIMSLCQEMLLMTKFDVEPGWSQLKDDTFFLVPAMNKQIASEEMIIEDASVEDCINIYLHFKRDIPIGLFERVVCVMLACNRDYDGTTMPPTITKNFAMFCFRTVEVFLVNESEERNFRISIQREDADDMIIVANIVDIINSVQERLKYDTLGSKLSSSMQVKAYDTKGNLLRGSFNDLLEAVSGKQTKMKVLMPDGRYRMKKISLFGFFFNAAQYIENRKQSELASEKEENTLQWQFNCFLSHTWGKNNETHNQVLKIGEMLEKQGLKIWVDAFNLKEYVCTDVMRGLRKSACILVFVTELYLQRVQNPDTNAAREFISATRKGGKYLLPVVLDPNCLNRRFWFGSSAAYNIQDAVYIDFSSTDKIEENMDQLVDRILEMSGRQRPANSFDTENMSFV